MWTVAAQSPDRYCSQHLLKSYRTFSHVYPKELAGAGNPLPKDQMKCDIWPVIIVYKQLTQMSFQNYPHFDIHTKYNFRGP